MKDLTRDPVCKRPLDVSEAEQHLTHEGHHYHFCSTECRERFEETPQRFAAKLP